MVWRMASRSRIAIITTSVGGWDNLLKPMIDSVQRHEPGVEVFVVDAGRTMPDEYPGAVIVKADRVNCSAAQNIGIKYIDADWYLVTDCDVLCNAPFAHLFDDFDENAIYGNKFHHPESYGFGNRMPMWIDGWIYAFSKKLLDKVGLFDERFLGSGFEDADICWRAMLKGYDIKQGSLPFTHLEYGQKRSISDGYDNVRLQNIAYLKGKYDLPGD